MKLQILPKLNKILIKGLSPLNFGSGTAYPTVTVKTTQTIEFNFAYWPGPNQLEI